MLEAINQYFDHIYVVTLQRATDRHLHIQQELQGLNYTFLYGADKNNLSREELINSGTFDAVASKKKHIMHKALTMGELGCALSHVMLYKDVIKNNYRRVLVLEDDVVINRQQVGLFSEMVNELPVDWQLFYLGFAKNEQPPANAALKKVFYHLLFTLGLKTTLNHTVINNLYPQPYSKHWMKAGFHDCTHAYAITKEAAEILLQQQTPLVYTADNLLAFTIANNLLKAYIPFPRLINQQYQVNDTAVKSYLHQ